jgi:DNA-3-methyladenine glycosylase I
MAAPNMAAPKKAAPKVAAPERATPKRAVQTTAPADGRRRCPWCTGSPEMMRYHDMEWGRPVRDDRLLFEFLTLEGAQAGLSWSTILNKRAGYRRVFSDFDPVKVARYTSRDVTRLMKDAGIVRNRLKIESTISNARAVLLVQREFGSFSAFVWAFMGGKPVQNQRRNPAQVPARTELSDKFSAELKRRGFRFVGTTICYAFMQAVGIVDDHLTSCFRYALRNKGASQGGAARLNK